MVHIVWYSEYIELIFEEEKHISFIQRPKMSKDVQFGAAAVIYMAKN